MYKNKKNQNRIIWIRECIRHLIINTKNKFKKLKKKLYKDINALSPKDIIDDKQIFKYTDKLYDLIKNKDTKNIAISGGYGTGKSTIVKTFINQHKNKKKYMVISIGSLMSTKKNTIQIDDDKKIESEKVTIKYLNLRKLQKINIDDEKLEEQELVDKIEKSIIKNIIYNIKYSNSRLSSVNISQKNWKEKYNVWSLMLIYITFYIICLVLPDNVIVLNYTKFINNIIRKLNIEFLYNQMMSNLADFALIIFIIYLLYEVFFHIFLALKTTNINIKIKDVEIEGKTKSQLSFLDQIQEIIYFFENSDVHTIFFEDIDRFENKICMKVIEDLKELNTILNSCSEIKNKITFVYSFKDGLFSSGIDKSKFYDYIISVMPISTRYNSYSNFNREINNVPNIKIDNKLILIASKYIYDIRTMKSIVNDFELFNEVREDGLDMDKLFAICIYKNYYVKEYDEIISIDNDLDKSLNFMKETAVSIIKEKINGNIDEIKIYEENILKYKNDFLNVNLADNPLINFIKLGDEYYDKTVFLSNNITYKDLENNDIYFSIDGSNDILAKFESPKESLINNMKKMTNAIQELESLNKNYYSLLEKNKYIDYTKEYIESIKIGESINNSDQKKDLKYELIFSGYIEDDYIDYITYVTDNSFLSLSDNKFIFKLTHDYYAYDDEITNPINIINCIENEYKKINILNINLVIFLYKNKENSNISDDSLIKKIYEYIINIFTDYKEEKFNFIKILFDRMPIFYVRFIKDISQNFDKIWDYYLKHQEEKDDNNEMLDFIVDVALFSNNLNKDINKIEIIRDCINEMYDNKHLLDFFIFMPDIPDNYMILKNNLITLGVKIKKIPNIIFYTENGKKREYLKDIIVENDLFEINNNNLYKIITGSEYDNSKITYEQIAESVNCNIIFNSILNNTDDFAHKFYLLEDNKDFKITNEEIINNIMKKTTNINLKREIIKREKFTLKNDCYYENELLNDMYNYRHIKITWKLINDYSKNNEFDEDTLIGIVVKEMKNLRNIKNKDLTYLNKLNICFIEKLLDQLYLIADLDSTKFILEQINNTTEIKKKNIKNNIETKELNQKIEYNLIDFRKDNYKIINQIADNSHKSIYIENWYKEKKYEKTKDIIDKDNLIFVKGVFSSDEIMKTINRLYKNKKIEKNELRDYVYKLYNKNKKYTIKYYKDYVDKIFSEIPKIKCNHNKNEKTITFILV